MKEIKSVDKDQVSIVDQREVKSEKKFVGRINRIKGLTLYKMSMTSGQISKVDLKPEITIRFSKAPKEVVEAKYEEGFLYVQALNDKNAKRKFTKIAKQIIQKGKV